MLRAGAEVCERGESVRFPLRERGAGFQAVVSPIGADEARVGAVILLKEEVEGVERLLALQREIADPLTDLEATLQSLHEQTGRKAMNSVTSKRFIACGCVPARRLEPDHRDRWKIRPDQD